MNNGSERFSEKKVFEFFDAEEERNLPRNAGKSDTQLRTKYEQKGRLFEEYLISRFDTTNYFGIITQKYHTQTIRRVRQGQIENYLRYQRSKMFWCMG